MTEEEKEAIRYLKQIKQDFLNSAKQRRENKEDTGYGTLEDVDKLSAFEIGIILNLVNRQQKEIEKKDKIINEMAKYIATLDTDEDICRNVTNIGKSFCPEDDCDNLNREVDCDICIKQYFESKV